MTTYKFHPLSEFFPMLPAEEFDELKASIGEIGQREPIVLYEDQILDGRNRYEACQQLGIEPKVEQLNGKIDPLALVVAANLRRRHLNGPQRIAILRKIYPPVADGGVGRNRSTRTGEPISKAGTPTTRKELAGLAGTSPRTVEKYDTLQRDAPDLAKQVEAGEATLHKAQREAKRRKARGTWRFGRDATKAIDLIQIVERWSKSLDTVIRGVGNPWHHDAAQFFGNKLDGIIEILSELRAHLKEMENSA